MTRIKAEAACCQLKGILILRPNFHQVEDPVDGNMLTVHPGYCPIGLHVGSLSQSFPAYRCARPPPSALDRQTPGGPQRRARLANAQACSAPTTSIRPDCCSPMDTSSTSANPANPTTKQSASTRSSASSAKGPVQQRKPKSQREQIVVPLETPPPRFYTSFRSAM